ncbi:MAG: Glu-tRNA(Gln) amidotransferase subunit GatE [Candidatus Diapherotrites archaeon]|nr:Glu-tRNA(Gln) amidotransferase subunit GatE [Candidatus Diapherotrites archaeon]
MEVIVITGPPASGKDTVADLLVKKGYRKLDFSDVLKELFVEERGREPRDKMELTDYAAEVREKRGRDVLARIIAEKLGDGKHALVGARSPEEITFLRKRFPVVVLLVDAPPEIREQRRPGSLERERKEEVLGLKEAVEMADVVIVNDGTLEELEEKVNYFLSNLQWYRVGLRAGLEIHQQLDTKKLFCSCPSELREEHHLSVERFLRPVASELGEYDPAALTEFKKGRKYIYLANKEVTCLVELDEEPPHDPTREAVETAIMVGLYLNATFFPYVQAMRKIVIDGSNTTGFQRTMLLAFDGKLKLPHTEVRIPTICLEEDAARPVERGSDFVVYNLDRLGIPLIEISTGPDLRTPEEVKEAAERIGMLLRATGRVKRGLGTIRQDVNVSIRGGARVEIKGVQQLEKMDLYVKNEVMRQLKLLELRELLKEREVRVEEPSDVTEVFRETSARFVRKALERGEVAIGFCVRGAKDLIGFELNPGRRFGTELSDYVKVHAGLGGILHSDELPAYGIGEEEVERVRELLGCKEDDAFILLVGPREKALRGHEVIRERINTAMEGVPPETRSPREDGTTSYARPLPGAARMYPETDVKPLIIDEEMIEEIRKKLPPLPEERKEAYRGMGLSEKMVEDLVRSRHVFLFDKLVEKGIDAKLAASIILTKFPYWRREGVDVEAIPEETWVELLMKYEKEYPKGALDDIVKLISEGRSVDEAIDELGARMLSEEETRKLVEEVLEGFRKEGREPKRGAIIGEVMKRSRGRASGKLVTKILGEMGL